MGKPGDKNDSPFPWTTAPADVRFAQTNITRYCYHMYVDYQRCTRLLGKGYSKCDYFKKNYYSLCPLLWIEKFDQQLKDGTFPVCLPPQQ